MSDTDFLAAQIRRLSILSGFPRFGEGMMELSRGLAEASGGNMRFAEELVTAFVDDGGSCPDVRAIKSRAYELLHPGDRGPIGQASCMRCGGSGFVSIQKLKKWNDKMIRYDYAAPCRCRSGKPAAAKSEVA